eukprot:s1536_g23.t1
MSAELYDTFVSWLAAQNSVDVVVLQETHWGLGRTANTWSTGGWHFISSPSSDTRYAGVCICVNSRVAGAEDLDYRVLCPGRLLHVRIHNPRQDTSVDVVGLYQWVPQSRAPEGNLANRHRLWMQLGQLLGTLPKRNVLLLAGDFNSTCCRLDVHVGSGPPVSAIFAGPISMEVRLTSQVAALLHAAPQFAYVEGKSIDSAIMRVIRHCRETRARLQAGALGVHARAAGEVCSSCYGSVVIGIDLSRAFDNLTRDVLQRSLQHAGVDPSLQRILLEIHCQCSYELQHHQFTGAFPLDKGVRQGCAVSPMLYSLFNGVANG